MGLVINVSLSDTFNVGYRRFRLVKASTIEMTAEVAEVGEQPHQLSYDGWTNLAPNILVRLTAVQSSKSVKIDVDCPSGMRIWRNTYGTDHGEGLALLAPVPLEHLASGRQKLDAYGRVAFGSRAWETFRSLDSRLEGRPCSAFIYASDERPTSLPTVGWVATYLRTVESRAGAHPDGMKFRPESTEKYPADNLGHWAVFWEVTDLHQLERNARIPISTIRGLDKKKSYSSTFRPEGPLLIEPVELS